MRLCITQLVFSLTLILGSYGGPDILCENIPRGMDKLTLGVDITELDLLPVDFQWTVDVFKHPVVDFTCNQGKVWRDPYLNKTYQIPDQIWNIHSEPGGWVHTTSSTYKSSHDVKKSLALAVGVEALQGYFSITPSFKHLRNVIENKGFYVNDIKSFVSATEAQFMPASILGLTSASRAYLEDLPKKFTDDPEAFKEYIRLFGTHYMSKGRFGGILRTIYETNSHYSEKKTDDVLSLKAEASFFKFITLASGKFTYSYDILDSEYLAETKNKTSYYGGEIDFSSKNCLNKWQRTVAKKPWIFGGELKPITDLIPEVFSEKRKALERAVEVHLDKAFLMELSERILIDENSRILLECPDLISDLELQLEKPIPDHDVVTNLGLRVRSTSPNCSVDSNTVKYPHSEHTPMVLSDKISPALIDTVCTNIPTGLNKLSLGVDITKHDFQPLDFISPDGYMGPIVDFTCNEGKVWNDPDSEFKFQLPDQISRITSWPGGLLQKTAKTYKTSHEIKESMALNGGVLNDVPIVRGYFSASGSYKHFSNAIKNDSSYVTDITSFVSSTKVYLNTYKELPMSSIALEYLESLPSNFTDNPEGYMSFVGTFGTHYLSKGRFGGFLRMVLETTSSYFSSHSESEWDAKVTALLKIYIELEFSPEIRGRSSEVDTEFSSKTRKRLRYYGGDTSLFGEESWKNWTKTVWSNPWLFGGTLRPISELVPEYLGSKKDALNTAIDVYILQSFLKDQLQPLKRQYSNVFGLLQYFNGLILKVEQELSKTIPHHENAVQLGKQLEDALDALVHWNSTQLVYRFDPKVSSDDDFFTLFTEKRSTYGPVNSYTTWNTHSWHMSWWIDNPYPELYKGLQLCGQNHGISSIKYCNDFSGYVTNLCLGNPDCWFRLKLQVSEDAPAWMHSLKVCYEWRTAKGGNCVKNGARSGEVCAGANTWTEKYHYRQDNRDTKCQIRFGIFNT